MDISIIVATLEGCSPRDLDDPALAEQALKRAIAAGGFTLLHTDIQGGASRSAEGGASRSAEGGASRSAGKQGGPDEGPLGVDASSDRPASQSSPAFATPPARSYVHAFEPQGITAMAVLGESHIALHSWPESGSLFVDIATCSGAEATRAAFESLCRSFPHAYVRERVLQLGATADHPPTHGAPRDASEAPSSMRHWT